MIGKLNGTKYIRLDCPKCKNIHTLMLMKNNICKCSSCGKKYELDYLINKLIV